MIVLHQANPESKEEIMSAGLKRASRGDKGNDESIIRTDKYLDAILPETYRKMGISRINNIYAYICLGDAVHDIQDGKHWQRDEFVDANQPALFELTVDASRTYVSDLDKYDAVKSAIENGIQNERLKELGDAYWESVIPLRIFTSGEINRPEAMITYDILPSHILVLK